jgi:phenylalanine-4-hydroxylase
MTPTASTTDHPETPTQDGSDPRCIPHKLVKPLPIGAECKYPNYSAEEQDVWRTLYARMQTLLPGRAADEYIALADVSRKLEKVTGWRIARTPGLLDAHDFFTYLANRVFPSTDYIRARSELDYTPAPDCFHDIFGHTPMIVHPRFADFYQKIGQAALACKDAATEEGLTRIYWFTVEFGLIKNPAGLRIYGNGIISSYGETQHCLTDKVTKIPYTPERLAQQAYDIWHFQDPLFVIDSFDQLENEFVRWSKERGLL